MTFWNAQAALCFVAARLVDGLIEYQRILSRQARNQL
jgi:hypothetical protein